MQRLAVALEASEQSKSQLRKILCQAAYEARLASTPQEICYETGIAQWTLKRLIMEHLESNPSLPRPKPIKEGEYIEAMDLGRGAPPSPYPRIKE
jgi:hypothetical protein